MLDNFEKEIHDFDFNLPEELIAKFANVKRSSCKLLHFDRKTNIIEDNYFYSLENILQSGDLILVNNTTVVKRRMYLTLNNRVHEAVFLEQLDSNTWKILLKNQKRLKVEDILLAIENTEIEFKLIEKGETALVKCNVTSINFDKIGAMPIPPYFKRKAIADDQVYYQSIFAQYGESVAAPTASLHFDLELIESFSSKDISVDSITLNVGYGTFAHLHKDNMKERRLHSEYYSFDKEVSIKLREKKYNRLILCGTTVVRAFESFRRKSGGHFDCHNSAFTDIFIRPPDKLDAFDMLITNFHLPKSSLLMLVASFCDRKSLLRTYAHAIENKYKFFSYGDAMLIT